MDTLVENMNALQAKAREGGGAAVLEKWKSRGKGKLSARERYVCDEWMIRATIDGLLMGQGGRVT